MTDEPLCDRKPRTARIGAACRSRHPEDNMNPVGRLYYNASTMICVPTSLDQEVGEGLGAQAGETKLTEIICDGRFTQVRRATEGPFNMVLEARA
jgi:hypothetical protein